MLLLMMCMVGANAMAYDIYKDGIYYYVNDEDKTAIVVYNDENYRDPISDSYHSYSGDIVIPSEFSTSPGLVISSNGTNRVQPNTTYTVIGIDYRAFAGCTGLNSVTIPNSVTYIGYAAFAGCTGLTSVTIPNSVTTIGYAAFSGCTGLTSVTIGNNVTIIGELAFSGCTGLTSVTIPNSVTTINNKAFEGCDNLSSITFHCKEIGDWFSLHSSITEFIIGDEVTTIGARAFRECTGLTSITIPNSVTTIGAEAFVGCTGLTSITIPNSVTTIGSYAFTGCTGLEKVIVSDIAAWCSIQFKNGILGVDGFAYSHYDSNPLLLAHHLYSDENTEIKDLVIPDNVTTIGNYAFIGCTGLTSVTIGNSVTSIGGSAFQYCTNLKKVDYSSVEQLFSLELGSYPFYNCLFHLYINGEELNNLVVPETITSIGSNCFYNCILKNVMVKHQTPPTVSTTSFSNPTCYHATLYVPTGAWESYAYDEGWYKFINIRETATETAELSGRHAYTLMDAKSFAYMVYDPVNGGMNSIASTAIDENNPNHCWQTITVDGQRYLYNIGAKKFAQLSPDGKSLTLTENVASIEMTDGEDGLLFGSQQGRQWAMVTNDKTAVDDSVIEGVVTSVAMMNANEKKPTVTVYDLNGLKTNVARRGLNIIRTSDGTVRKVMVK